MSTLIMTSDWTIVERFQSYFASQFAKGKLIWAAQVSPPLWGHQELELVVFDSRMRLTLSEYPLIQNLLQQTPALWLAYEGISGSFNDPAKDGVFGREVLQLDGTQLTHSAVIAGRERAIAMHRSQKTRERATAVDPESLAQVLQQLIYPTRSEWCGFRQAMSWMRPEEQGHSTKPPGGHPPSWSAVSACADRLDQRLNQIEDLISILGNQYSCHRQSFSVGTLIREVASELPWTRLSQRLTSTDSSIEPHLAFADPKQIRSCLSEILATLSLTEASQRQNPVSIDLQQADHQWEVLITEASDTAEVSGHHQAIIEELQRVWNEKTLATACQQPDFLMGLGLTRERARHNGGDVDLHLSAGQGLGIRLILPQNDLNSVLTCYQRFLLRELPHMDEVSFVWVKVSEQASHGTQRHLFARFIHSRFNSLAMALPFEDGNWLLVAPVNADEERSYTHWIQQEWAAYCQTLANAIPMPGFEKLVLSKLISTPTTAPIETWVSQFQKDFFQELHQDLQDVAVQVGRDNRRLQQLQTGRNSAPKPQRHSAVPRPNFSSFPLHHVDLPAS